LTAGNGRAALDAVRAIVRRSVILDILMPELDGTAVCGGKGDVRMCR